MSDPSSAGNAASRRSVPHLDKLCEQFKAAWDAGQPPRIEPYLRQRPGPERAALLRRLLALEIARRLRGGEKPAREEYLARFPEDREVVQAVFATTASAGAPAGRSHAAQPRASEKATGRSPAARPREETPDEAGTILPVLDPRRDPVGPELPQIPGYEILGELGRGGMGVVYQARQVRLERLVALKMILVGQFAGVQELSRFRTEAEAVARLQHANIVQIHEVGEVQGAPFFSLEFVAGGSLEDQLDGEPWSPDRAAELVETLARAIQHAHRRHIIHRDLKPANVLLTEEEVPKITDFGLAKQLDAEAGLTPSEAVLGTPSYMAPEQAGGKSKRVGPAADIYALGAILYELVTGRPPFQAATHLDTILQVISEEPVPPRALQASVPRDLETICLKCLQKKPADRYASARALAEDLRRFREGRPIQARSIRIWDVVIKWVRRNPLVAGLVALLLAVSLLGIAAAVRQHYQMQRIWRDLDQQLQNPGKSTPSK